MLNVGGLRLFRVFIRTADRVEAVEPFPLNLTGGRLEGFVFVLENDVGRLVGLT